MRDCLLAAGKYGLAGLPLAYKVKFGWCMLHYKMSFEDGVALYGKYVGNWGGEAPAGGSMPCRTATWCAA